MMIDAKRGRCSEAMVCHGEGSGGYGLYLPKGDIKQFFASLYAYKNQDGAPYVNAQNPAESWMLCNLTAQPGAGSVMPPPAGLTDPSDVTLVRGWLLCGAPGP